MKSLYFNLILISILFLSQGCRPNCRTYLSGNKQLLLQKFPFAPEDRHSRLVSWNIEFLGNRKPLRTDEQINSLAQRIETFCASIIIVNELKDGKLLEKIASKVKGQWEVFYQEGQQNAIMYDSSKVKITDMTFLNMLNTPPHLDWPGAYERKPVTGIVNSANNSFAPFRLIGVHFHWEYVAIKIAEAYWIDKKIDEFLCASDIQDIVIIGDYNSEKDQPPLSILNLKEHIKLIEKQNGESTYYTGKEIDHCFVTEPMLDRLDNQSVFVIYPKYYNETPEEFEAVYSDHFPIFIDIK